MRITLLGSFIVTIQGEEVTQFESDASRLLLAYLALNMGTPYRREALADLFWPDLPRADGLHALRQTLTRLRKAIGDGDEAGQTSFLTITRQTIAFNTNCGAWVDAHAFSSLVDEARTHLHRRLERCFPCLGKLREAVQLYHGDLLKGMHLESQGFEEWLLVQREHLHRQVLNALFLLASADEQYGSYDSALRHARRQVDLEPWREEAHRQIMRNLALNGERSAAMKQYEFCQLALRQELDAEPETETVQLYQQIRSGAFAQGERLCHNLPAYLTPFIGRQVELQTLAEQLNHPDCRLLTLLGPGGIGKTRLAVQAAAKLAPGYRDGVVFVSLMAVHSVDLLVPALAQALQLQLTAGNTPSGQLHGFLRSREMLLVLDGFEHVNGGGAVLAEMLHLAPGLSILVTSRERLNVAGEWTQPVSGLTLSNTAEEAVRLFIESARRVTPGFQAAPADLPTIVEICKAVEGTPLAIELAAGWTQAYTVGEIAGEIRRDLDFLATTMQGIPDYHQSLRAVFNASWARLSEAEQLAMARLSIFPASFDRPAIQQILGVTPGILISLVNQSLLRQETVSCDAGGHASSSLRYQMHEMIRRFAAERAGDLSALQREFCRYYLGFLIDQEADLDGSRQPVALARIDGEIENVKLAWQWTMQSAVSSAPERPGNGFFTTLARAGMSLFTFLDERCRHEEGAELFAMAAGVGDTRTQARFIACQSWFAFRQGQQAEGRAGLEKSLSICEQAGFGEELAFTLSRLGAASLQCGAYELALQQCQRGLDLYRSLNKPRGAAVTLATLGHITYSMGQFDAARTWCLEALEVIQEAGGPYPVEANCLRMIGNVAYSQNQYDEATSYYEQALERYRLLRNRWGESAVINNLGSIATRRGQYERGYECFERALVIKDEIGDQWGVATELSNLGAMADDEGDYEAACIYYQKALALCRDLGSRNREGRTIHNLANAYMHMGQFQEALSYLEQARNIRHAINDREGECRSLDVLSLLYSHMGQTEKAFDYAEQALSAASALGNRALQAYALQNRANAWVQKGQLDQAYTDYLASLDLRREMGESHLAVENQASIAHLHLLRGEMDQARSSVEEVLAFLEDHPLTSMEDPFFVYLASIQVLRAMEDPRADGLFQRATTELEERAARLPNKALRQAFLNNIPSHRALRV